MNKVPGLYYSLKKDKQSLPLMLKGMIEGYSVTNDEGKTFFRLLKDLRVAYWNTEERKWKVEENIVVEKLLTRCDGKLYITKKDWFNNNSIPNHGVLCKVSDDIDFSNESVATIVSFDDYFGLYTDSHGEFHTYVIPLTEEEMKQYCYKESDYV